MIGMRCWPGALAMRPPAAPGNRQLQPDALRRLVTPASSDTLRRVINTAATNAEDHLARSYLPR